MTKEPIIDAVNVVLCDDIRKENNAKDILIGVYSGDILVEKFPINLLLALWVQFKTKGKGVAERELRVIDEDGKMIVSGEFGVQVSVAEEGYMSAPLTKMPFSLGERRTLKFQWRKKGQRWKTLIEKKVRKKSDVIKD